MKKYISHFQFQKKERNGIFLLVLIMVVGQGIFFAVNFRNADRAYDETASLQLQRLADSLRLADLKKENSVQRKFNPNFITDFKGYQLGMSLEEIDRLLAFRKQGKYVNSPEEFQEVTQVSDSLLHQMAPWFQFPEWTQKKKTASGTDKTTNPSAVSEAKEEKPVVKQDINGATAEQLIAIRGIGKVYADRIIAYKNKLGGYSVNDQLYEVWGIDKTTIEELLTYFTVKEMPTIKKQNLNMLSIKELSKNPYITYAIAKSIVKYRSSKGNIATFEELLTLEEVTEPLVKRLPLYFYLEN